MNKSHPLIRIKDAWLLRANTSVHLNELWGEGKPLRDDDEYAEIAESYKKAWKPYEKKILAGIYETLGLEFNQNIIDVYIAPWFSAFSDPLIIGVVAEPDVFVDCLTHELIHRLLTDNTLIDTELFLLPEWEKLFGHNHSFDTLVHIPVHAVHKAIYLSVLNDQKRMQRDIDGCINNGAEDYIKAWEYVNNHDYRKIINELKESYKGLAAR